MFCRLCSAVEELVGVALVIVLRGRGCWCLVGVGCVFGAVFLWLGIWCLMWIGGWWWVFVVGFVF